MRTKKIIGAAVLLSLFAVSAWAEEQSDDHMGATLDRVSIGPRGGRPGPGPRPGPRPGPVRPGPIRPGPRPGPVRVYDPIRFRGGGYPWPLYRPVFTRPFYYWNWAGLRLVTCTAEDSYGDQFPVTETGYVGIGYQANLNNIEDGALSRCYAQSPNGASCVLASCTPGY
jgi:hypothetical protein